MTTTRMGFEPTRAEHIGLAVQRLNHSATSSHSDKKALLWVVIGLSTYLAKLVLVHWM